MAIGGSKHGMAAVAAVAALLASAACGSDGPDVYTAPASVANEANDAAPDDAPDATPPAVAPTGTVEVKALDNTFIDDEVNIAAGTEVVWTNGGRNDHDIVPVADGQSWGVDLDGFTPGDSYAHVFAEPGAYPYYCTIHGTADVGMTGTIIVN